MDATTRDGATASRHDAQPPVGDRRDGVVRLLAGPRGMVTALPG